MVGHKASIYCPHYRETLSKKGCYFYDLIGVTLWICDKCNTRLGKVYAQQRVLENNLVKFDMRTSKQSKKSKSVKTPQSSSSSKLPKAHNKKSVRRTVVCGTAGTKQTLKKKRAGEIDNSPASDIDEDVPEGYLTYKMATQKYGKEQLARMEETGWLSGVTGIVIKGGKMAIPESDYERAFRAAIGKEIQPVEWD